MFHPIISPANFDNCRRNWSKHRFLLRNDYGIGFVAVRPLHTMSLTLFPIPEHTKPPYARFDMGMFEIEPGSFVSRYSLTTLRSDAMQDMSNRILDVAGVDESGIPILSFASDSAWVKVSLDCGTKQNPPSAWINVSDAEKMGFDVILWNQFFKKDWALTFQCDSVLKFYSQPSDRYQIFPELSTDQGFPDYCMRVIKTSGAWMQVHLESPSMFLEDPSVRERAYQSKTPPPRVWIKYLDDRGRPIVWYLSE